MNYTIVTALININRDDWGIHFGRKWDDYKSYMEKLILRIDAPMCIYVQKDLVEFVTKCRQGFEKTKIIVVSLEDYVLYPQIEQIEKLQKNPDYINRCKEKTCPEVCKPLYNAVVNNKIDYLHKTSILDPFNTEYFLWLDAGYGHGKIETPEKFTWSPTKYIEKASENKIVINILYDSPWSEDWWGFFDAHQDFIDGGFITVSKKSINEFHELYYDIIKEGMKLGIIDDDQYFMTMAYIKYKNLFNLVRISGWSDRANIILGSIE